MGKIILIGDVSGKRYEVYESASGVIIVKNVTDNTTPLTADSTTIRDAGNIALNSHASRHDIGGADAIPGLASHKARHEKGGADEVKALGSITLDDATLASLTADPSLAAGKIWFRSDLGLPSYSPDGTTVRRIPYGTIDVDAHASRHDIGGADAIPGLASHHARHEYGGADALGAGSLDRTQLKPLGFHYVKTASPTPGTNGEYGTPVDLTPAENKSIAILLLKFTWGGTFGTDETVTIRVTVTFSDNTTASITKSATAVGDAWAADSEKASLMKDGVYVNRVSVDSSSNQSSTNVTTSATIYGLEI